VRAIRRVFWSTKRKMPYKLLKAQYFDLTRMNNQFKTYNEEILIHPTHYYGWDKEIRGITMNI
jgi:hypothetical protein